MRGILLAALILMLVSPVAVNAKPSTVDAPESPSSDESCSEEGSFVAPVGATVDGTFAGYEMISPTLWNGIWTYFSCTGM